MLQRLDFQENCDELDHLLGVLSGFKTETDDDNPIPIDILPIHEGDDSYESGKVSITLF